MSKKLSAMEELKIGAKAFDKVYRSNRFVRIISNIMFGAISLIVILSIKFFILNNF